MVSMTLLDHWTAFGAIAVEQLLIAVTVQDKVELPDQIPNVVQSGIHPLPAKWTVNVSGIAGYENTPDAQLCRLGGDGCENSCSSAGRGPRFHSGAR